MMDAGLEFVDCAASDNIVYGKIVEMTGNQYDDESDIAEVTPANMELAKQHVMLILRKLGINIEPKAFLVLSGS